MQIRDLWYIRASSAPDFRVLFVWRGEGVWVHMVDRVYQERHSSSGSGVLKSSDWLGLLAASAGGTFALGLANPDVSQCRTCNTHMLGKNNKQQN